VNVFITEVLVFFRMMTKMTCVTLGNTQHTQHTKEHTNTTHNTQHPNNATRNTRNTTRCTHEWKDCEKKKQRRLHHARAIKNEADFVGNRCSGNGQRR
jgi:hypothetical protein